MIDAKWAIQVAKEKAAEILDQTASNVEEIERETYNGREAWSITLSFPPPAPVPRRFAHLTDLRQYKRFLIDAETSDLLAVKIREVASQ
jgi:hypothetical protein